jgi:hypothetical protein
MWWFLSEAIVGVLSTCQMMGLTFKYKVCTKDPFSRLDYWNCESSKTFRVTFYSVPIAKLSTCNNTHWATYLIWRLTKIGVESSIYFVKQSQLRVQQDVMTIISAGEGLGVFELPPPLMLGFSHTSAEDDHIRWSYWVISL